MSACAFDISYIELNLGYKLGCGRMGGDRLLYPLTASDWCKSNV